MAVSDWSTNPAQNARQPGINAAEGMAPSLVDDDLRQMMADIAAMHSGSAVATRAALTALTTPQAGVMVFLGEGARAGIFATVAGVLPASDTLQGLYIPSAVAGFYYARQWDGINGRPEWFGFVTTPSLVTAAATNAAWLALDPINAIATTNNAAMAACIALCPVTRLSARAYYVTATVQISQDNREIKGVRKGNEITLLDTTEIVLTGSNAGTGDVLILGKSFGFVQNGVASWTQSPRASGFTVRRTAAPAGYVAGQEAYGPCGVRNLWAVQADINDIYSVNHSIGFYWGATVYCRTSGLHAYRDQAGSNTANDFFLGFFVDGNYALGTTFAGGNASLYAKQLKVGMFIGPVGIDTGYLITGGFEDTWLDECETYGPSVRRGVQVIGCNDNQVLNLRRNGCGDIHLHRFIIDGAAEINFEVAKLPAWATLDITDVYLAVNASNVTAGFSIHDGAGSVTISGGEVLCWPNTLATGGNAAGINATNYSGLTVKGVKIVSAAQPVVLVNSPNFTIEADIYTPLEQSTHPAIQLSANSSVGTIACRVWSPRDPTTPAGFKPFTDGVTIDSSCTNVEVNCTGIDPNSLSGKKLRYNGTAVTAPGAFGTNCVASGVVY